jgi:hypothetical protein
MLRDPRHSHGVPCLSLLLGVVLLGTGCGSAPRESEAPPAPSAAAAPSASAKAPSAPPVPSPPAEPAAAPPPSSTAEPAAAAATNPAGDALAALRKKELGEVAPGIGKQDATRVAMLQAICKRVVVDASKQLGCEECVDCGKDPQFEGLPPFSTRLVEALPGSFTKPDVEQGLVVTKAASLEGYLHRYFLLEKRDGRFWVEKTFTYRGRPYDVRLLETGTGRNMVAMMMASPGMPPPSALRVWRLLDDGAQYATLVPESRPCLPCSGPCRYEMPNYVVSDKDNDQDDDITVQIDDFTLELEKESVVQRLWTVCRNGGDFRPHPQRLTFDFTFEFSHFETSATAAAKLSLEGKELRWRRRAWE